uniref:Branchpoint-bridging protein n=1 Tax=Panagrolaimus sp. PS1159 TaxID=55785 RepID=A0AC35GY91_9BILA
MSSRSASDGESTLVANSSISGDDDGNKKTLPKREKEHHGGAGDNIGRNYRNQSPTSRQGQTSRRRRPPPKRQLGGNGMGGCASSYMPMSFSQRTPHDQFALDDVDVLLYTVKELCALVESDRFVCGPTFMAQFQVLTHRLLYVTRNLSQRCRQNAFSPPHVKPSLYDNLLRVRSPDLLNPAHDFSWTAPSSGCGILIRGKGSVKNAKREERLRSRNTPGFEHLKEPLHVLITAEGDDEAECDAILDKCKRRIEKLLKPEYDEFKRRQLAQLAIINGNYDATRGIAAAI